MKRFQITGKMLTRDEQRKIRGGDDPSDTIEGGGITGGCSQNLDFCGRSTGGYDVVCCSGESLKCENNICVK